MIEVKGLYKDFGALHVLRGVSLNVEQGDIISIIGPSGSGKSTLLRSINLLEKPTYGEIWVEGKLITPPDPYLHWDVIRASKTYGELRAQGMEDELAIMKIKKEDLLKPREGMAYQKLMRQIQKDHFEDTYSVRRRVGMVFQHFNLFPHMTVLENMIYAPHEGEQGAEGTGGRQGPGASGQCRDALQDQRLSRQALRRSEAAGRHCADAGHGAGRGTF